MDVAISRGYTTVRAYSDQLHALMGRLGVDPLDEHTSVSLVLHIVNNRSRAAHAYEAVQSHVGQSWW